MKSTIIKWQKKIIIVSKISSRPRLQVTVKYVVVHNKLCAQYTIIINKLLTVYHMLLDNIISVCVWSLLLAL